MPTRFIRIQIGKNMSDEEITARLEKILGARRIASERPESKLTNREIEVAHAWASGTSIPRISESLGIAEGTVRNHITSIYSKLGISGKPNPRIALMRLWKGLPLL